MLPGARLIRAANPAKIKGKSFLGKLQAPEEEVLKILE
jgi:hypothetical protein